MNQKEPIQILVTLDQNYRHILTVMLYSLACTNPQEHFIVRIMHPAKEEWSMEGMRRLLPGGQREQFTFRECAVLEEELSGAPISARWPEVMYYRLFAPWVIPECPERMLYLDPDIVVLNRVRPLWDMDLCGSWFAGASHVQRTYHEHLQDPMQVINDVRLGTFGGTYLNSGVLLMDMKQIRENSSAKEILDFIHRHRAHLRLPDQDVLNMLYKDHLTAVDPFIYKAYSNQQSEELAQILYTATKIVTITMAFPVVFVMTFSEEFLTAWVGSDFLYLKDIMIIGLLGNYSYCAVTTLISVPRVYLKLKLITAVTFIVGIANAVLTVIFQALAFGKISMISISSLTLLGGTLASLFLDSFGLMGMEKRPFNRSTLIGFAFSIAGILVMMDFNEKSSVIPVILSLTAGVVIVISRTINAVLSNSIGALQGSFINHLAGLPITIVLAFLLDGLKLQQASLLFSAPVWTYFGGAIGVVAIACNNVVVPKISAFHFTLLSFLGQMATSILIDLAFGTAANIRSVYGGLLIAAGMILNMLLSRKKEAQA